jgi:soluble lytic murein transglycosylase-like protein
MARPVSRRLTQRDNVAAPSERVASPGYSPEARLVGTGDGAARSAAAVANEISDLIGNFGRIGSAVGAEYAEKQARQGETDARTGTVDPTKLDRKAYANAVELVETEASLIKDRREITEGAQQFINNGDSEGLDAYLAEQFNTRWAGVKENAAKLVNPMLAKLRESLLIDAANGAAKIEDQRKVADLSEVATGLLEDARGSDGVFRYDAFHERVVDLYGTSGAYEVEQAILDNLIRNQSAVEIMRSIPDRNPDGSPTIKLHPEYGQKLVLADQFAQAERQKQADANLGQVIFDRNRTYDLADAEGRLLDEEEVLDGAHLGLWSYEWAANRLDQNRRAVQTRLDKAADTVDLSEAFRTRTHNQLAGKHPDETMKDEFDRYIETYGPEDEARRAEWIITESAATGYVYRPWQDELKNVDFTDAQRLDGQVQMFQALYARNPNVARKYVSNDDDFQRLVTASTLRQFGVDPAQRLAALGNVDLTKTRQAFMEGDLRKTAMAHLNDAELKRVGGFFDPDLARMPSTTRQFYANELSKLVDALGSTGMYRSSEELVTAASKMMQARFVVAGDKLLPRTPDMPADADAAMTWFVKSGVAEELVGTEFRPEDVELVADSRTAYDGTYRLVLKGGIETVNPGRRYRIDEIAARYRDVGDQNARAPYQQRWDAVINPQAAKRGPVARAMGGADAPSVTRYVAERKYLRPDQQATLDAKLLPHAQRELAKASDTLAYETRRLATVPAGSYGLTPESRAQMERPLKEAQKKAEFWQNAVATMAAPKAAPKVAPAAVPVAQPEAQPQAQPAAAVGGKAPWYKDPWQWRGNPKAQQYTPLISAVETAHGLPNGLLGALIQQESAYNPKAKSHADAQGLAQIVPRWHPGVDPYDWKQAIPYAGQYLSKLHKQFGSWEKALAAYNTGPDNLRKALRKHGDNWLAHVPLETRNYVRRLAPRELVASNDAAESPIS